MALSRPSGWADELGRWLAPFLAALSRPEQRRWAPLYLRGLLLPGERKSIEPMAARIAPGEVQHLHHFVSASPWATEPLEAELVRAADRLVGGPDAALVVDDTALVKQGAHSVGVQRRYCGEPGKRGRTAGRWSRSPWPAARCRSASAAYGCSCRRAGSATRSVAAAPGCPGTWRAARSGGSRSTRSTACWPPGRASVACSGTRDTARPPSSAAASPSGG